jgi:hypothetical protein
VFLLAAPQVVPSVLAQPSVASAATSDSVQVGALRAEVTDLLAREIATHLADIKSLDPPPTKVVGAGATGEYTWGTFMRAVGSYAELSGNNTLAGQDLAREVGRIGLLEYRLRSTRFSQLYAVLALQHFGRDLKTNPVWQSLSEEERGQWRKLLDISSFYDAKKRAVINLPDNYLGVAARIASISHSLGLTDDRALVDGVITRAAEPFMGGSLYADDAPPTGRFDRYSNEYARFVWESALLADRKDILDVLRPTLKAQMRLWWDLVQPDGYGYAWGRSLGAISYMDTLEIVAFCARHPEFRPTSLTELASAFYQAWRWLHKDFRRDAHLLSVFAYGRGNYAYISREREWQQTTGFLAKTAISLGPFVSALEREKITQFPVEINRPDLTRFEFFRRGQRQAGVWLVRQGRLHFTLPITTGTKPGVADYLPAPHGLPGFAAPVEQVYPALASFIELADGRVFAATDGADEIEPGADGRSLRAVWRRWAVVGRPSGELAEPGITSELIWRLEGTTLNREERFAAEKDLEVRRWWVAVPTVATQHELPEGKAQRVDRFKWSGGALEVSTAADWPLTTSLHAAGDTALGRGARGPVPLHLLFETRALKLSSSRVAGWRISLKVDGNAIERR